MSETKNCIMVGLPLAGKTSYLAAFWSTEKDNGTGHKVSVYAYPDDTLHLDAIKKNWMEQRIVDRTVMDDKEIKLPLVSKETGKTITLGLPDFKGERFVDVLRNNPSKELTDWIDKADGILFFMQPLEEDKLEDDLGQSLDELESERKAESMDISDMSHWARNILLLKFLAEHAGADVPLAVCFSAWDKYGDDIADVAEWVNNKHRFFKNVADKYFDNVKYFGVSAQGREYKEDDTDAVFEEWDDLSKSHRRAFVFTNKKDYDITLPLEFLINS